MDERISSHLRTPEVERLLREHGVRLAYLFGSHARGTATPSSDVDVALVFGDSGGPIDRLDHAGEIGRLLGRRFGRRVDAVVLDDASPLLRFEAAIRGETIFAEDPEAAIRFELRTRTDFEEFRRIQDLYTAERRERLGLGR